MQQSEPMVCATCRVITHHVDGSWVHTPELQEKFSRTVCDQPAPQRTPKDRELRFGRGDNPRTDRFAAHGTIHGVGGAPGSAVALATNGSYKMDKNTERVIDGVSWGYLATNGAYGVGTSVMPAGMLGDRPLQAELRAMWRGLRRVLPENPVLIVTNSEDAINLIAAWRQGGRPMPQGYDLRPRPSGRVATVVRLAELIETHAAQIDTLWVRAGSGVALNEGAHSLARIAQAFSVGRLDKDRVVTDARHIAFRTLAPGRQLRAS